MSPRAVRTVLTLAAASSLVVGLSGCATNSVLDLEVGDCFDSGALSGAEVGSVETIDCAQEHDAEVFASIELDDGDYPGPESVKAEAEAHCRTEFEEFVGLAYESSEILYTTMFPTESSWNQARDRTALCILLAPEDVTGSLEGAGY